MAGGGRYLAYLVRLWTVCQDSGVVWRASAEDAHTGERRAFADLAGLCSFLREATAGQESDESIGAALGEQQDGSENC